eukprot:m.34366 g.34366  ORF g.34366 m.34366 type:complete len:777 (-) comp9761_c0_seq2:315-2645(-)
MHCLLRLVSAALLACALVHCAVAASNSFTIANNQFMRDGQAIQIKSACIHYSRVPATLWRDRLLRIQAAGFNAIQTYNFWNFHNYEEGKYDFEGDRNVTQFLEIANELGLMVLFRAGPYGCGEWEFGGFPAWLLAKNVTLRTYEDNYIAEVTKWWNVMLPKLVPYLYENGGPVIMVQVENEFGSYGDVQSNPADEQYMVYLVGLVRGILGDKVTVYTTDGGSLGYMQRGSLQGSIVYTVGDFGPGSNMNDSFEAQRQMNGDGLSPNMCSEFYSGWLTHWGEQMANTSSANLASSLNDLLQSGASVSMYMGHGGTNFGFYSGANGGGGSSYQPHITSYDYDSPISEGGQHGYGSDGVDKYTAVQKVLLAYPQPGDAPTPQEPAAPSFFSASVNLMQQVSLMDSLDVLTVNTVQASTPNASEFYGQNYGFTLYSTGIRPFSAFNLSIPNVRDRAQVFLNGAYYGTTYRVTPQTIQLPQLPTKHAPLDILVENMGRINYGHGMTDPKGIPDGQVLLNQSQVLDQWVARTLPMETEQLANLKFSNISQQTDFTNVPTFFTANFTLSTVESSQSTYFLSLGWGKGVVWINGNNVGRYWDAMGPQHALYIPSQYLVEGTNQIVILELEAPQSQLKVQFVESPNMQCDPTATKGSLNYVKLYDQASAVESNQLWTLSGTQLQLQNDTSMCVAPSGAGVSALVVAECDASNANQQWKYNSDTQEIINNGNGMCMDVTAHADSNGAPLEVYACNGGDNQQFSFGSDGRITSEQQVPLYLTVCWLV